MIDGMSTVGRVVGIGWGMLSNLVALGVAVWIDERDKPRPPKVASPNELKSYDEQYYDLFHDEHE